VFLHDPDGSNPRLLVSGGPPAWSPDGDRIAYGDVDEVGTFLVGVVRRDSSILWSGVPGTNPTWSPDGTRLAVEVGFPDTRTRILDAATGAVVWDLEGRHPAW
jgi:Tol biopolymer transport system component